MNKLAADLQGIHVLIGDISFQPRQPIRQSGGLWKVMDAVDEVLSRIEQQKVEPELPEGIMALPLLQMAYRRKVKLTPQQARCAIEALPYENPKLNATAIATMDGQSFAEALDRCIARSRAPLMLNAPKTIEIDAAEMKRPMQRYRRY
jgi:hypothetical protein